MAEIILYGKLSITIPGDFKQCSKKMRKMFFSYAGADYAYTNDLGIFLSIKKRDIKLKKEDVQQRIQVYQQYNQRMVPGFQMGEMMIKESEMMNIGIITYKSNAEDGALFNMLGVGNFDGDELAICISVNMDKSYDVLSIFTKIMDSITILDL